MAGRRANGEGTIFRRKDGRYEAAAYFLTSSGQRKRRRFYGTTREAVHAKLTEAQTQGQRGIPVPDNHWRLGDYLDYWLEDIIKRSRRPTTYLRYESSVRLHLKPGLGHAQLSRLSVPEVQQFWARQLDLGKSLRTVQIMREVLRSALSNALREEIVARNVAARTTLAQRAGRRELRPWSVAETQAFLRAATNDPYAAAFLLQVIYGLRRGEAAGIRWCDIDFAAGKLYIRQQVQRINGEIVAGPLKTHAGRRDLALVGMVAERLRTLRPETVAAEDLVFRGAHGGPLDPHQLYKHFQRICEQHQLRRIRLHDLRHSLATFLKKLGVQPRDAQLILGHASVQTTQEIYQHQDDEAQKTTLQQVERLFLRSVHSNRCRQLLPSTGILWPSVQRSGLAGEEGFELRQAVKGPFDTSPITEVMLALRGYTSQWFIGRVAVKHSRHILPTQPVRRPRDIWSFTGRWLTTKTIEEPPCSAD